MRNGKISIPVLFILLVLLFPSIKGYAKSSPSHVSLLKEWHFMGNGSKEIVTFTEKSFRIWIGGPGLPVGGLDMEKQIAAILPNPKTRSGMVVVGPDSVARRPYWVIHWRDLGAKQVKLYIGQKTYPTVAAARRESKLNPDQLKTYRAIKWGI